MSENEKKTVHVVSFDIPSPPNYGGVIAVFYLLKELKLLGVDVILHCFQYGERKQDETLNKYCKEVNYYPRDIRKVNVFNRLPYIVKSRLNAALEDRLNKDSFPILLEGLHCAGIATETSIERNRFYLRMHNIEWQYYGSLGDIESNFVKSTFFKSEARKLKKYEAKIFDSKIPILTISKQDYKFYKATGRHTTYIPPCHPYDAIKTLTGKGSYALFHGNLSVNDNLKSVQYLIKNVFSKIRLPFKIAGLNPPKELEDIVAKNHNIELIPNPSEDQMRELQVHAQIHMLYSFQSSGIKLKLLNALYQGRHVVVNNNIIEGSGLDAECHIYSDPESMRDIVYKLKDIEFTEAMIEKRKNELSKNYNNETNAEKIVSILYNT